MVHSLGYTSLRNQKGKLLGGYRNYRTIVLQLFIALGPITKIEVVAFCTSVTIPNLASLCQYSPEELRASQLSDPCICPVLTKLTSVLLQLITVQRKSNYGIYGINSLLLMDFYAEFLKSGSRDDTVLNW